MSSSGTRKREEMLDADGNAIVDGVLTPTPDSPADSEWRSRAGPLDVNSGNGGPWKQEDCSGEWFPRANSISVFLSTRKFGCVIIVFSLLGSPFFCFFLGGKTTEKQFFLYSALL